MLALKSVYKKKAAANDSASTPIRNARGDGGAEGSGLGKSSPSAPQLILPPKQTRRVLLSCKAETAGGYTPGEHQDQRHMPAMSTPAVSKSTTGEADVKGMLGETIGPMRWPFDPPWATGCSWSLCKIAKDPRHALQCRRGRHAHGLGGFRMGHGPGPWRPLLTPAHCTPQPPLLSTTTCSVGLSDTIEVVDR